MSEPEKRFEFIAEIDGVELACRIAEAACGIRRPPGKSAQQALHDMERLLKSLGQPDVVAGFHRAARVAAEYFAECVGSGRRPS
ncbi:MAG: hypothetical protein WAP03_13220 [Methylorubrum rhodinum]|uniref:hypothetical protein n=1 Tax=Methylorubrum rhodinum TaxID=29428 RepID=UPI003BB081E2